MQHEPLKRQPESIPTRYTLLSRLQSWDDQESWRVFFDTYWRLIYSVALKSGLSDCEAQDVVQETIISVAKDIHKFKRDRTMGSFKGWLCNLTRWRIADQKRKRSKELNLDPTMDAARPARQFAEVSAEDPELERFWEQEWQRNLINTAIERVKYKVKEEHFQIFDLNVMKEWPAAKIARVMGINIGQVYLAKHRVGVMIRKELQLLEIDPC